VDSPVVPVVTDAGSDDNAAAETPDLPNISEYWPDAPQRLGPPADHYELPGVEPDRTTPAWHVIASDHDDSVHGDEPGAGTNRITVEIPTGVRPRRPRWKSAALLAALLGAGAASAWVIIRPTGDDAAQPPPTFADQAASAEPTAAAPDTPPVSIGTPPPATGEQGPAPDAATFELVDGSTEVNVAIGPMEEGWFRVTTPEGSGVTPQAVVEDGTLRVRIEETGPEGSARVDVLLSEDVDWAVRAQGGFREATFDLSRGTISRIDLFGGLARMDLALPSQEETIPIVMAGGVNNWRITTDGEVPVRAAFRRGAGKVSLYGDKDKGVAREAELRRGSGDGGIDLNAEAGVGTLTVTDGGGPD
jgi:hypothetical protein